MWTIPYSVWGKATTFRDRLEGSVPVGEQIPYITYFLLIELVIASSLPRGLRNT